MTKQSRMTAVAAVSALALALGLAFAAKHARAEPGAVGVEGETIAMVGFDGDGKPAEVTLSPQEYARRLGIAMQTIQDSALTAVGQAQAQSEQKWALRVVVVGTAVSVGLGIGPILQLKVTPHFRMLFSDSKDPAMP